MFSFLLWTTHRGFLRLSVEGKFDCSLYIQRQTPSGLAQSKLTVTCNGVSFPATPGCWTAHRLCRCDLTHLLIAVGSVLVPIILFLLTEEIYGLFIKKHITNRECSHSVRFFPFPPGRLCRGISLRVRFASGAGGSRFWRCLLRSPSSLSLQVCPSRASGEP